MTPDQARQLLGRRVMFRPPHANKGSVGEVVSFGWGPLGWGVDVRLRDGTETFVDDEHLLRDEGPVVSIRNGVVMVGGEEWAKVPTAKDSERLLEILHLAENGLAAIQLQLQPEIHVAGLKGILEKIIKIARS